MGVDPASLVKARQKFQQLKTRSDHRIQTLRLQAGQELQKHDIARREAAEDLFVQEHQRAQNATPAGPQPQPGNEHLQATLGGSGMAPMSAVPHSQPVDRSASGGTDGIEGGRGAQAAGQSAPGGGGGAAMPEAPPGHFITRQDTVRPRQFHVAGIPFGRARDVTTTTYQIHPNFTPAQQFQKEQTLREFAVETVTNIVNLADSPEDARRAMADVTMMQNDETYKKTNIISEELVGKLDLGWRTKADAEIESRIAREKRLEGVTGARYDKELKTYRMGLLDRQTNLLHRSSQLVDELSAEPGYDVATFPEVMAFGLMTNEQMTDKNSKDFAGDLKEERRKGERRQSLEWFDLTRRSLIKTGMLPVKKGSNEFTAYLPFLRPATDAIHLYDAFASLWLVQGEFAGVTGEQRDQAARMLTEMDLAEKSPDGGIQPKSRGFMKNTSERFFESADVHRRDALGARIQRNPARGYDVPEDRAYSTRPAGTPEHLRDRIAIRDRWIKSVEDIDKEIADVDREMRQRGLLPPVGEE